MKSLPTLVLCVFLCSCQSHTPIVHENDPDLVQLQTKTHDLKLASINIMDRNGLSETISTKDRLKNYENNNFLTSQPYQKVLRVFAKDKSGNAFSIITSYYPTGQIKQYLEVNNGRARGRYLEWHPNGQKKLQATVLGGNADLDEKSQSGWAFDETSYCWNEQGTLVAAMAYARGTLEGTARYYHNAGSLSEEIPYVKGEIEGTAIVYNASGTIIEKTGYAKGLKEGSSLGFWSDGTPCWNELWQEDLLQEGTYFEQNGTSTCGITAGNGKRCLFGDVKPLEIQQYINGKPEGEVLIFDEKDLCTRRLQVKDGEKHGEEIVYWPHRPEIAKVSIPWAHGKIHGTVKTWYEDGTPESSKEMSQNLKQGLLTAWYRDGKLMLIEEYEKDRLKRGDYLKKGELKPVSQVIDGKGVATFFEADGTFRARIGYHEGKPAVEELLTER